MDGAARRAANEEAVGHFFAAWDPAWRWILILGMRQIRADPVALGTSASAEANGHQSWADENYAYGPLAIGVTAAAVNEAAQHCEDLFALLRFLREPVYFARDMASYRAGKVIDFGRSLVDADDATISRLFLVPDRDTVRTGLAEAADPGFAIAAVEAGRARLGEMVRETSEFYRKYEDFHVQYKHGLKVPLRPFGILSDETIASRKGDRKAPLFSYTVEPFSQMVRRPGEEQTVAFQLGPTQQANLMQLVGERNVLRLRLTAAVNLDEVVERSYVVLRLLQMARTNRLALGKVDDGNQRFCVPGAAKWEQGDIVIKLDRLLSLSDFSDPSTPRAGKSTRGGRRRA